MYHTQNKSYFYPKCKSFLTNYQGQIFAYFVFLIFLLKLLIPKINMYHAQNKITFTQNKNVSYPK